ncbi:MAG: phytanoyl-CoA dioxygenase family protein [Fimbriimonadaceae bacterium]|nr:phytanoyl-CoA dioxygenase family protein [Fimbriimonadaceae bacterium]
MGSRLAADQVADFHRDGYLSFNNPVFDPADFVRLKAIFEEDLARYGEDDLDTIHFRDERLMEFLMHDRVLDLVEPLMGPNIGLWSSHFISKPPFTGKRTPWHEDSAYWDGRISTMENLVTVWLALDPVDIENGSMGVIPGTHVGGFSDYTDVEGGIFGSEIEAGQIDESKAHYFTLAPNECSLHEARIIHGANANTSPRRRAGYTMRYFPTTSLVNPERNPGHKIWLARGRDMAGNRFENA